MSALTTRPVSLTHWLDASPGEGRLARARYLAETVEWEQLVEAADLVTRQLTVLVGGFGIDTTETRRLIASMLIRVSIAERAIRIQWQRARKEKLDRLN